MTASARTAARDRQTAGDDVASLVTAAAGGDERAWGLLVAGYARMIRAIARRHRLSAASQEDVVQQTWLLLLEHIDAIREPTAIGGWLSAVARNECLRMLAASDREVPVAAPLSSDAADAATVEDEVIRSERRAALHRALDNLPEHQRRVIRSQLAEPSLKYDAVSARLGMPRGSIGPTRGRGLARLRRDPRLADAVYGHVDHRTVGPLGRELT